MTNENSKIMEVNFEGVEDAVSKGPLPLGVYDFTITGMEFKEEANERKTPYCNVTVATSDGNHTEKFYLTAKALPKLKHMLLATGISKEKISSKLTSDALYKLCVGKSFRAILSGREYVSSRDNKVYTARQFAFSNYAAPIGSTNLVFDPSKHIEKLGTNPNVVTSVPEMSMPEPNNDMPF